MQHSPALPVHDAPQPVITVALPMYKAREIGWLALESLARQVCPYPWELIMIEEQGEEHAPMDARVREAYVRGLHDAGCVRIHHEPLAEWIPLSHKWRDLASLCAPTSQTFILQAADCYSSPNRLKRSHEAITRGADWTHSLVGVFLDIPGNRKALYRHPPRFPTGLNMAVRTELVRGLPTDVVRKGVDRWLHMCATRAKGSPLTVKVDTSQDYLQALDTHGFNNISRWRGKRISERTRQFSTTNLRIADMLPEPVVARLRAMTKAARIAEPA
jgi:hypothetical protein